MWSWVIAGILALVAAVVALSSMNVRRHPGLEKEFDIPAAIAYSGLGGWPVFTIERRLALKELSRCHVRGRLLDAGCGPGYLLRDISRHHPGLEIIGLDLNPAILALARRNLKDDSIKLVCADALEIPLEDGSLDFVISTGTLHHWPEAPRVLKEIFRVLKPGGQILIMDLRRDCPRIFYILVHLVQCIMPPAIRRVNGPVGSFWASYTVPEMRCLMSGLSYREWRVNAGVGWFYAWGIK